MIEVNVDRVGTSINTNQPVVILARKDNSCIFPIGIGFNEALAIFICLQNEELPRPLTHDLLNSILDKYEIELKKIEITDIKNNVFYAEAVLNKRQELKRMDCRPSDGIALSLRQNAPIYVCKKIAENFFVNMEPSELIEPLEVRRA